MNIKHKGAQHITLLVFEQVNGKVFIEKMGFGADVLLVQAVQYGMAGTIRCRAGASRLLAAEILALATKGPLIDFAIIQP